jgi:S-(hydroxymethyl)glutathione dehydrogenase/alcohol dehydrogenase
MPLVVEDVELAPPNAGEVTVELAACTICHSDVASVRGDWGGVLPAVFGHEAAGVVVEVGPPVDGVKAGDHVVVTLVRSCGRCRFCRLGEPVLCSASFTLDEHGPLRSADRSPIQQGLRTGAFAERVTVHASQVVPIPDHVPLESAPLLACGVLTGVGAVLNTARVPAGSSVVIVGAGGVGLNSVQGAVLVGAEPVIAIDLVEAKLATAANFGATHVLDAASDDVVTVVRSLTDGGADYAVVTVGVPAVIEHALQLVRRGGTLVVVGMPATGARASFDPAQLAHDGQRILGSKLGSARPHEDVPKLVDLYRAGRLKLDELISGRYALGDINAALTDAARGDALRNAIVFDS